jgi:hypothetical protein
MKLRTVTVEFDMVISVKDGEDEEKIARDNISNAVRDMSQEDFGINIIDYKNGNAYGWDDDCIPYGEDRNTKIGEYGI